MSWVKTGLCAGVLLAGGAAMAQSDGEFLTRALRVNQLELKLGKMATERASTPEVKAMGAKMVKKHTEIGQRLSEMAQQAGVSGNPAPLPEDQATYTRLASLPTGDFDKSFKQTIDAGHVQELAMYRDEVSRATSPRLRALSQERVAALKPQVEKAPPQ